MNDNNNNAGVKITEDELCCPICYETYNSEANFPRTILCGHPICESCLNDILKLQKETFECPTCRASFPVIKGIDDFPKNYAVKDIVQCIQAWAKKREEEAQKREEEEKKKNVELAKQKEEVENQIKLQSELLEQERIKTGEFLAQLEDLQKEKSNLTKVNKELVNKLQTSEELAKKNCLHIKELQSHISNKEELLEAEKKKLDRLMEQSAVSNDEMNKLKENIIAMSKELQENEFLKMKLQKQNEEIRIQMQKEKIEVMENLLRVSVNNNDISNSTMIGQFLGKIWSVLPLSSGKMKSLSEYKLLEAKGNSKRSKVRKAQCMGTYYALKRISQQEDNNYNNINNNNNNYYNSLSLGSISSAVGSLLWSAPKVDQTIFRECMLLYKLHHPNIVKATGFVKSNIDNSVYMEMPYYEYDIEFLKWDGKINNVSEVIFQVLRGLVHLHSNEVVHRGLIPECILSDSEGNYVISSFSRAISTSSITQNMDFKPVCIQYTAPEILYLKPSQMRRSYWEKADMWSLGCIFYFLLTKQHLFRGSEDIQILSAVASITECRPNNQTLSDIPSDTAQLFRRQQHKPLRYYSGVPEDSLEFDLLCKLLRFSPEERISSKDAINHPYFNKRMDNLGSFYFQNQQNDGVLQDSAIPQFVASVLDSA